MADNTLTEDDGDDLIVVETETEQFPDPNAPAEEEEDTKGAEAEEEDDADEDEERMGVSDDDSEEEILDKNKKNREHRSKRRQIQKQAKERAQRELEFLRQQNAELMRRMQAVEGNTLSQNAAAIDMRMSEALNEVKQAEMIIAKAVEAGNGADVATAMRLRDEAKARADQMALAKQRVEQAAKQTAQPQADPRVANYAQQWLDANPWYRPNGNDEDSAITKAIDATMTAEGWNPASEDYWHELTRRVASRINQDDDSAPQQRQAAPRRKAPPTGTTREHAPVSSRKEVYVTPERKQAMIDAGVWDDPVRRNQMLKAYQAYDRDNTAR